MRRGFKSCNRIRVVSDAKPNRARKPRPVWVEGNDGWLYRDKLPRGVRPAKRK